MYLIYKAGRGERGADVGLKLYNAPNNPQRTSYTKAVQQQELLQHQQQAMIQNQHQQRFPLPHHYSMTMGSRRGSRSNLSSSRNTFQAQQASLMQRTTKQISFEEGQADSLTNIPPLPLRCLGFVCLSFLKNDIHEIKLQLIDFIVIDCVTCFYDA